MNFNCKGIEKVHKKSEFPYKKSKKAFRGTRKRVQYWISLHSGFCGKHFSTHQNIQNYVRQIPERAKAFQQINLKILRFVLKCMNDLFHRFAGTCFLCRHTIYN